MKELTLIYKNELTCAMVWMCSLKINILETEQVMVGIENGGLWGVNRSKGGALISEVPALIKKGLRELACLFCLWGHNKAVIWRRAPIQLYRHSDLGLLSLQNYEK